MSELCTCPRHPDITVAPCVVCCYVDNGFCWCECHDTAAVSA